MNMQPVPQERNRRPSNAANPCPPRRAGAVLLVALLLWAVPSARAADGDLDTSFDAQLSGGLAVSGVTVQPDGKIVFSGQFSQVSGVARRSIARLNTNNALDLSFDPNANSWVYSIAVRSNGQMAIAGSFNTVGGSSRSRIALLNPDGSLVSAAVPSANNTTTAIAVQPDGKMLVAGSFTNVSGVTRNGIVRLAGDGTLDATFDPGANGPSMAVAVQADGRIVFGGAFTSVGGAVRNRMARVWADGTLDTNFNPDVNDLVNCIIIQADGKTLLAGEFTSVNGVTCNHIARLNVDGSLDAGFNPNVNGLVRTLALQADGKILLGGTFTTVSGVPRNRVARLWTNGNLDGGFDPNASSLVRGLAVLPQGRILMVGDFAAVGGTGCRFVARLLNGPATNVLQVLDATRVEWLRGGTAPEVEQVTFELSTNAGVAWNQLGYATRTPAGWQMTGLSLPAGGNNLVRARGRTVGGAYSGSSGLIEQVGEFNLNSPPVAQCQDVTVSAGADCTAPASIDHGSFDPDFGDMLIYAQSPPGPYPLGTTPVTLTVTDDYGASNSCVATVTVVDNTPPLITCPANITTATDAGSCLALVPFAVTATDNCGAASVSCVPPSGSAFPLGTTVVTCTARDTAGNLEACIFTVTVNDTEPPLLVCSSNLLLLTDAGQCSKTNVIWPLGVSDNCTQVSLACVPPVGSTFAVGLHPVTCAVTDASGNSNVCSFTVTVVDLEAPQVLCPADQLVPLPEGGTNATVTFAVSATDNCDGAVSVVCAPASGSAFPPGTTTVQCSATDNAGNTGSCSFTVRVNQRPVVSLIQPTNNASFLLGQNISLLADASDPDGDGVSAVDFLAGTNLLGTATNGYLLVWSNAPAGSHDLAAAATDGLGSRTTSAVARVTVLDQPPTVFAPVTISNFNRQSGLFIQTVRITNPTPAAFPALRLSVALDTNSLARNVRLWNAAGTNDGVPFVFHNFPLEPGQSVDLNLEYYIPDRRTMPAPVFTVDVMPGEEPVIPDGTSLAVREVRWLTNGVVRVSFATLSNRVYFVQYSPDLLDWRTALPAITGHGRDIQWLDTGPPKTETAPEAAGSRFYRLILLP